MRILYDFQIFSGQKFGGISRLFYELLTELNSRGLDFDLALKYSHNKYLEQADFVKGVVHRHQKAAAFLPFGNSEFTAKAYLLLQRLLVNPDEVNKQQAVSKLQTQDFDIFHPTYYDPYFLEHIANKPYVVTVFDMTHEKFPQSFSANDPTASNKAKVVKNASRIIAISQSTKNDIVEILGYPDEKIDVIHLANSLSPNSNPNELGELGDFVLFVSGRAGYKNFEFMVRAIAPIMLQRKLKLFCAGGGNFTRSELELFELLGIEHLVQQFDPNDQTLAELYSKARAFIYPSLYEGFGIPILEAFSCECPVLASNTSSLPEVGGDAAAYFAPVSDIELRGQLVKVLEDSELCQQMVDAGVNRLQQFSWTKMTELTLQTYEKATSS